MYSLDRYSKQGFEWESSDEYRCWQERSFREEGVKNIGTGKITKGIPGKMGGIGTQGPGASIK